MYTDEAATQQYINAKYRETLGRYFDYEEYEGDRLTGMVMGTVTVFVASVVALLVLSD